MAYGFQKNIPLALPQLPSKRHQMPLPGVPCVLELFYFLKNGEASLRSTERRKSHRKWDRKFKNSGREGTWSQECPGVCNSPGVCKWIGWCWTSQGTGLSQFYWNLQDGDFRYNLGPPGRWGQCHKETLWRTQCGWQTSGRILWNQEREEDRQAESEA